MFFRKENNANFSMKCEDGTILRYLFENVFEISRRTEYSSGSLNLHKQQHPAYQLKNNNGYTPIDQWLRQH